MKIRTTLGLLLLAGALFGYIRLREWPNSGPAPVPRPAGPVFPGVEFVQARAIEVGRSNQVIRVERQDGRWRVVRPDYPADGETVTAWLNLLTQLTVRAHMRAQDVMLQPDGRAAFGLDPSQGIMVTVEMPTDTVRFKLGNRTIAGEKVYLEPLGGDGVYVTDATVLDQLPDSAEGWRARWFLSLAGLKLDRIQVRTEGGDFEIARGATNRLWRLQKPRAARADSTKVERVLQQLQLLRITRFVEDAPGVDLEPYGLHAPHLGLTFFQGTNLVLEARFGRSPTNAPTQVYAQRSGYPNVVCVARAGVDALAVPYTEFLDYQLIDAPLDPVNRVEVTADESFVLHRETNGVWRITDPVPMPADPALVQGFLAQLKSLKVVDIAKEVVSETDWATYGLAEPLRRYALETIDPADETNATTVVELEFGKREGDRVCVRRTDERSVYLTPLKDSLGLPGAAFELRDRRLWQFSTNDVSALTIELNDQSYRLLRSPGGGWSFAPGSQGIVNTFALEEAVVRLGYLRSHAWVAQGEDRLRDYGFDQVDHRLTVELRQPNNTSPLKVAFGASSPSGGPFAVTSLENGLVVFEFPPDIYLVYRDVLNSLTWRPDAAQ